MKEYSEILMENLETKEFMSMMIMTKIMWALDF